MFRILAPCMILAGVIAVSQAEARSCANAIVVMNNSGRQIDELYFNSTRNTHWGADRLGDDVLTPGQAIRFGPGTGGRYDFRVVWNGGVEAEARNVDICSVGRLLAGQGRLIAE